MDLLYKIVRRLFRDQEVGFSRNKNFSAYEDPMVQHALRIFKHLKSVEDALLSMPYDATFIDDVAIEEDKFVIKLRFENGRRESYLNAKEWQLLIENSAIQDRLGDEYVEFLRRMESVES